MKIFICLAKLIRQDGVNEHLFFLIMMWFFLWKQFGWDLQAFFIIAYANSRQILSAN